MSTALTERDFYEVAKDIAPIQSFSFEEACDFVKYKKEQEVFKDKVNRFHKVLANSAGKTYEENAPDLTKHQFADGQYIRTITMPAKTFFISKVHLQNHPFFIMTGELLILSEGNVEKIKAPHYGVTTTGTQRVLYIHEECVFVTVHCTDKLDLKEIEEEVIAKPFSEVKLKNIDVDQIDKLIDQIRKTS